MEELKAKISFLKDRFWNPHAKFIIISTTHFKNKSLIVSDTIELLWKLKALKVILLLPQQNNREQFDVHTWFPYSNGNCANNFDEISIVDVCNNGNFFKNIDLFPDLIPWDLHQCPVRVKAVILPPYVIAPENITNLKNVNFTEGTEILTMNNIAAKANFLITYSVSKKELNWGAIEDDGKPSGLFHSLILNHCDIIMSILEAAPTEINLLDTSSIFRMDSYAWCVPTASYKPKWENIYRIFSLYIWILIFLCFILIAVTYTISNTDKNSLSFAVSLLYVFSMLLNVSVSVQPKLNLSRYIFILWSAFCLIITTSYQSELIKFLVKPMKERQITNTQELINEHITIGLYYYWTKNKELWINEHEQILSNISVPCLETEMYTNLNDIAYHKNYSAPIPRSFIAYISSSYEDDNNNPLLYMFEENFISLLSVFYAYDGFPFMSRIDDVINRMIQAGLLTKWIKDTHQIKPSIANYEDKKICFSDVKGVFYIYFLGIGFASFTFILENVLFWLQTSNEIKISVL